MGEERPEVDVQPTDPVFIPVLDRHQGFDKVDTFFGLEFLGEFFSGLGLDERDKGYRLLAGGEQVDIPLELAYGLFGSLLGLGVRDVIGSGSFDGDLEDQEFFFSRRSGRWPGMLLALRRTRTRLLPCSQT